MLLIIDQQESGFYSDWNNILYATGGIFYLLLSASICFGHCLAQICKRTVATFGLAATGMQVCINLSR